MPMQPTPSADTSRPEWPSLHVVLGERFSLDLSAAVAAHPFAVKTLKRMNVGLAARRAAVRTAIMPARPEKV
ncbi:hypothetical protein [Methylobacterium nigriterrae]|uniref:hypothetical protein n=1 Tax=Methylobacterium nigriterrae TaxID=3127512 RepID=UPI00301368EE